MVDGGPACDRIMRAVDALTAELLGDDDDAQAIREAFPPGWLARAITHKETTLAEVVARFRRNLIAGGVPKK